MAIWVSTLKSCRTIAIILGLFNFLVVFLGGFFSFILFPDSDKQIKVPIMAVSLAAVFRIVVMVRTGVAQKATADSILNSPADSSGSAVVHSVVRLQRRMRYKRWLWWSRLAMAITLLQIVAAIYLVFSVANCISHDGTSSHCHLGIGLNDDWWKQKLLALFVIIVFSVPLVQCFAGYDVLKWSSFYTTQDDAWRDHYHEVFDHGIREALCCLGRVRYLRVSEEDEVYSVAQLLGELVAYRASGTGHLQLLAGLALLQGHGECPQSLEEMFEAPKEKIQDALASHKFAEAAYTGPLLDFGRYPVFFPCVWLYRQGILTPWKRNRRPILIGDNWWRGHAAAFLKYVNLPPETLRRGRVCQEKCEAAYFVVVLHHLRSVLVAVRGTETAEDLIIDGLGRGCFLSREDLDGLLNHVHPHVKQRVESSFPHHGHSGVVEAARDLYMQIEGNPQDNECGSSGFLSSLMGAGCECDGYSLCIVGHSLGGAIATLLGVRLHGQFPNLHVYAYGPLPCVDLVIAEECSEFVTSIIHDNEFSARLSVGSIMRLRAAAISTLSEDSEADTALIFKLARRFLYVSDCQRCGIELENPSELPTPDTIVEDLSNQICAASNNLDQNHSPWSESNMTRNDDYFENPFCDRASDSNQLDDPVSKFLETVPGSENQSVRTPPEVFLPGLVIHLVPQRRTVNLPSWKGWKVEERVEGYKAYLADRESFRDIVVSPYMFLDHLPWRCHEAMKNVLEGQPIKHLLDESQVV